MTPGSVPKAVLGLAALSLAQAAPVAAGIYATAGVRNSRVTVCFVPGAYAGDKVRADQIRDHLGEIEGAANIRFEHRDECPAPTSQSDGSDRHDGDVRVVIPFAGAPLTGAIPGNGCSGTSLPDGSSWSNFPDDLEKNRACLYNMRLYGDADASGVPWLNHTLHEFGHGLGLRHEHERADATAVCPAAGGGGSAYLTGYDTASVMHYKTDSCGINGNYDHTGLSRWDRLSLHVLYPEERRVAELAGRTVIRAGERLTLRSGWEAAGADIGKVARAFRWRIGGVLVSSEPRVSLRLSTPGTVDLELGYEDFLGRKYAYRGAVRVLEPREHDGQLAAVVAASLEMMASAP